MVMTWYLVHNHLIIAFSILFGIALHLVDFVLAHTQAQGKMPLYGNMKCIEANMLILKPNFKSTSQLVWTEACWKGVESIPCGKAFQHFSTIVSRWKWCSIILTLFYCLSGWWYFIKIIRWLLLQGYWGDLLIFLWTCATRETHLICGG